MAACLHCTGSVFEHMTGDERILYCANCGWEHRERLLVRRPPAPRPVFRAARPAQRHR